jgi:hypothetical protein
VWFASAVALLAGLTLRPAWRARGAADWAETQCTITDHFKVRTFSRSGGGDRHLEVGYSYRVGDRTYQSRSLDFVTDNASAVPVISTVPIGTALPCWYDPGDPSSVVLGRRGWSASSWAPVGVGLCLVALVIAARRAVDGNSFAFHRAAGLMVGAMGALLGALVIVAPGSGASGREIAILQGMTVATLTGAAIVGWRAWRAWRPIDRDAPVARVHRSGHRDR